MHSKICFRFLRYSTPNQIWFVDLRLVSATAVSRYHKLDQMVERQRIEDAGECVMKAGTWRVGGVLADSRAFGDKLQKPFVVVDREIQEEITDTSVKFLILESDGL